MNILFSAHAKTQISRRGIPRAKVLDTIENADNSKVSFRNRQLYQKKFRGKILEVVAIKEDATIVIITAYYL